MEFENLEAFRRHLIEKEEKVDPVEAGELAEYERFMGVKLTPLELVEVKRRLRAMLDREGH